MRLMYDIPLRYSDDYNDRVHNEYFKWKSMENKIIYFLTIEDVQKAAMETINRELTFAEIESIK